MRKVSFSLPGLHVEVGVSRHSHNERRRVYRESHSFFEGNFNSWADASQTAAGYDAPQILSRAITSARLVWAGEAAYERDTVVFDRIQFAYPLLAWLLQTAGVSHGRLSVIDYGGALGSSYFQNRGFLRHLTSLSWSVIEQEQFVAAGKAEFETDELKFFFNADDCVKANHPNFLLLSSVLQYLEYPYELLKSLLSFGIPNVLIDRTMACDAERDQISIQHVPENIYHASYPVWFLSTWNIERIFKIYGYKVVDCFDPHPGSTFGPENHQWPYVGWFLQKVT